MAQGICRAKNPSACKSPRCPSRRGGATPARIPQGGIFARVDTSKTAPYAQHGTYEVKEHARKRLANKALALTESAKTYPSHDEAVIACQQMSFTNMTEVSGKDQQTLYDYTNQSYSGLNRCLRQGRELNSEQKEHVEVLDRLIANPASPLQEPTLLTRSIKPPTMYSEELRTEEWVDKHFAVGTVVEFNSYSSTSLSQSAAFKMLRRNLQEPREYGKLPWELKSREEWKEANRRETEGNILLEMVTKDGLAVSSLSHMPQETEILLGRDKNFLITSIDKHLYTGEPDNSGHRETYTAVRIKMVDVDLLR